MVAKVFTKTPGHTVGHQVLHHNGMDPQMAFKNTRTRKKLGGDAFVRIPMYHLLCKKGNDPGWVFHKKTAP